MARVYVWGRWFVWTLATFAWLYPLNVDEVVHAPNAALAMLLLATNGYLHYRLATERAVSWRWMLALSALDLAMLSGGVAAHRGLETPFFVGYYPSLALFAVVFGSVRLTLVWVTLTALVYAALCLAVEPGLDFSANDEEILLIRVAGMYLVVVVVNLISRVERIRRMEAVERERELQREAHRALPRHPQHDGPVRLHDRGGHREGERACRPLERGPDVHARRDLSPVQVGDVGAQAPDGDRGDLRGHGAWRAFN